MIKKITVVMSLFVMTGCGLGHSIQADVHAKEAYRTCIIDQIQGYSVRYSASERTVEKVTKPVVSECKGQEEAYLVAMTDLAVTITGGMVPPEKFLEDEEATVRGDLHDLAVSLVEQSL